MGIQASNVPENQKGKQIVMPRKIPKLSNTEIGRIRSNLSRQNTKIGNRLQECAMGTLTDSAGNPITMTAAELKAADILFKNTLPAQAASTIEDVTQVEPSKQEIEIAYQQAIASLPATDILQALQDMPVTERQALIDSMGETKQ